MLVTRCFCWGTKKFWPILNEQNQRLEKHMEEVKSVKQEVKNVEPKVQCSGRYRIAN